MYGYQKNEYIFWMLKTYMSLDIIKVKKSKNKIRVNITVDKVLLDKAKHKLDMFGGKVSTLFNAYLSDFVSSMDKNYNENNKQMHDKIKELEDRLKKVEKDKS